MKKIDVQNQPTLSAGRTLEICVNGIRYRLFRSLVTVMVIAVAIAFMMNILCEAISMQSVARMARNRTAEDRLATYWTARLSVTSTPEEILQSIDEAKAGSSFLREAQEWAGMTDAEFSAYRAQAHRATRYLTFFDQLDYGRRRLLIRNAVGISVFDDLQDSQNYANFQAQIAEMRTVRLPERASFAQFLQNWPSVKAHTSRIQQGHAAAIAAVTRSLQGKTLDEMLAASDAGYGEMIRSAGFLSFDEQTQRVVAQQAQQARVIHLLESSITQPSLRGYAAAISGGVVNDMNTRELWKLLLKRENAALYLAKMRQVGTDVGTLTAADLLAIAQSKADEASLDHAMRITTETGGGFMGAGARMTWLMLISLLVCAVGISNAMLMSVTERFREIATLKCLGALDGFIMMLFVMEASLFGLVGGAIGGIIGSLIGFGRMAASFGALLFPAFPATPWLIALAFSLVAGTVIAALAGVYPSYLAARLAPMEAMRIE